MPAPTPFATQGATIAIKTDIEGLPTAAKNKGDGIPPDPNPILSPALGRALVRLSRRTPKTGPREYIRPSDALKCARQLSYTALGLPGSEMDVPGALTVSLGTVIHEWLGPILAEIAEEGEECPDCFGSGTYVNEGPDESACETCDGSGQSMPWDIDGKLIVEAIIGFAANLELETDVDPHPLTLADGHVVNIFGYADLILGELAAVDMKSINGTKFRKLVGADGPAMGAEDAWLIQAGIAALVFGCAKAIVLGVGKEAISDNLAKRHGIGELDRILPEWSRDMDEFGPIVEAELARMWGINRLALTPVEWTDEVDTDTDCGRCGGERTEPTSDAEACHACGGTGTLPLKLEMVADGILAMRRIPGVPGEITNPLKGAYVQRGADNVITATGNYWGCAYCNFQGRCEEDGSGRVYINPRTREAASDTDAG